MCKIRGFCKYSPVLESFVNYVFFMHPVIFNAINKLMKKNYTPICHQVKRNCVNWKQNYSDRRYQAAPAPPALTLKPPGCSTELLCTRLLACKWEWSCNSCGKEIVWTITPTKTTQILPYRSLIHTLSMHQECRHAGQVSPISSAAEAQTRSSSVCSKCRINEFNSPKIYSCFSDVAATLKCVTQKHWQTRFWLLPWRGFIGGLLHADHSTFSLFSYFRVQK